MPKYRDHTPRDVQAERALLGSILIDEAALLDVLSPPISFKAEMLWNAPYHQPLFRAMVTLLEERTALDFVTLCNRSNVPPSKITELLEDTLTPMHAEHYAQIIKRKWQARQQIQLANDLAQAAYNEEDMDYDEFMARLGYITGLGDVSSARPGDIIMSLNDMRFQGTKTIYPELNYTTGGLIPGQTWVIGGTPGTGKTAFILNLTTQMLKQNLSVCLFALQESQEEMLLKLLGILTGVDTRDLREGDLSKADQVKRAEAEDFLASAPLRIYDNVREASAMWALAHRQKLTIGLDVVIADYIQAVAGQGKLYERVATGMHLLASLSRDIDACVLIASQLSLAEARRVLVAQDGEVGAVPAFKGAGDILEATDKAVFLIRERGETEMKAVLAKNKQGETGSSTLHFDGPSQRISPMQAEI